MSLPIYRLRRWLIVIAVLFITVIAGMYLYARLRQLSVLKAFPGKIGIDIKQTASGFQFSKSEAGRTVFSIRAKSVKEFKLNGHAELHDVSIVLYGRDTSRFDQIYGDEFSYDQKSGDVTARGDVQIDLEANPSGVSSPDQATPKELKNPIHLKTSDLVFNQNSGNASTDARVDFSTPQATGWAVGVQYTAKSNTLTLSSQIHVTLSGEHAASLFASHGRITRDPREVVLENPHLDRQGGILQAEEATFFLTADNQVERVLASGNVNATSATGVADQTRARADEAELLLTGKQNLLHTATLTGNVHAERGGSQPMQGDAGRAVLDFRGQNRLLKVHASDGVRLAQHAATNQPATDAPKALASAVESSTPQDFDLRAPVVDFFVADGRRLSQAETSGAAQMTISPAQNLIPASTQASGQRTVITAGRFDARFVPMPGGKSQLTSIHGAPNAKIVNVAPGVPDRVSTSQTLDAAFLPEGGVASIVQQGSVAYSDGMPPEKLTQAWADRARYTPADRILVLTGSPRVSDGGMVTTGRTIRINRATDDAIAEGDVKSTYNELKEQPDGALLASASPIHVTAATMTAHNSPAVALYQGNARLWQDANLIEAPSIEFDRDRRSLVAQGTAAQPVLTTLVQGKAESKPSPAPPVVAKAGRSPTPRGSKHQSNPKPHEKTDESGPIAISAARLSYSDPERRAHYDGGVTARGTGFTATSAEMDIYLLPRSQASSNQSLTSPGRLDRMVAQGKVVIDQPGRRAEGNTLVYTAADDKFVLTGGSPSIFDAERGKITGVSLTFFRHDDRVLVEGEANTPVVTQTRVAR
ncbi:MAG: LPS export ABC transporter periplasmic protein LptC [Candidatus Sulfotelmatobacter sp.]